MQLENRSQRERHDRHPPRTKRPRHVQGGCPAVEHDRLAISQQSSRRSPNGLYHFNGMTSWSVAQNGEVKHVYA